MSDTDSDSSDQDLDPEEQFAGMADDTASEGGESDGSGWSAAEREEQMNLQHRIDGHKRILSGIEDQLADAKVHYDELWARAKKYSKGFFPKQAKVREYEDIASRFAENRVRPLIKDKVEQANEIRNLQGRPEFVLGTSRMGGSIILDQDNPNVHLSPYESLLPYIDKDPKEDIARAQGFTSRRPSFKASRGGFASQRKQSGLQTGKPRDPRTGRFVRAFRY